MQTVEGFGGFFLRAKDPAAPARRDHGHLGSAPVPTEAGQLAWMDDSGPVVFAPFPDTSAHLSPDHAFMLNVRIRDLSALTAQRRSSGVEVSDETEMDGVGRFARVRAPESNPIEVWQPADE